MCGPVTATTLNPLAPAAPSGLQVTGVSGDEVELTWTDNSNNETGFEFVWDRENDAEVPYHDGEWSWPGSTPNHVGPGVTSLRVRVTNSYAGGPIWEHRFRVRAVNAGGGSRWSDAAAGRTLFRQGDEVRPAPEMRNVVGSAYGVELHWFRGDREDPLYAAGWEIQRDGQTIATINDDGLFSSYWDRPPTSGSGSYRVRAYTPGGFSDWSNAMSGSAGEGYTPPPTLGLQPQVEAPDLVHLTPELPGDAWPWHLRAEPVNPWSIGGEWGTTPTPTGFTIGGEEGTTYRFKGWVPGESRYYETQTATASLPPGGVPLVSVAASNGVGSEDPNPIAPAAWPKAARFTITRDAR